MVGDGHIASGQELESEQEVELGSKTPRPAPRDPLPPIVLDIVQVQFSKERHQLVTKCLTHEAMFVWEGPGDISHPNYSSSSDRLLTKTNLKEEAGTGN